MDSTVETPPGDNKPKRHKKRGRHSSTHTNHPLHIDEKWLVSYSDMMTLLFGLFVMLYSIASENQGDPNQIKQALKAISGTIEESSRSPDSADDENAPTTAASPAPSTPPQEQAATPPVEDLTEELDAAKKSIEELNASLAEQTADKERLAKEKEELEKKLAELEKSANATDKQKATLQSEIAKKSKDLQHKEAELLAKLQELEVALKAKEEIAAKLQEELNKASAEIEDLKRKVASQDAQEKLVLLSAHWGQEKFDIDLELKNPFGKVYSFKNKSHNQSKTAFLADASKGPGTELIRIDSMQAGKYTAKVKVYNSRGATDATPVKVTVMTPFGEVVLGQVSLDGAKAREIEIGFVLDPTGKVTIDSNSSRVPAATDTK